MYRQSKRNFKRRTLVDEFKAILQQYPDDGQIFKEIVQNAEDAGATEVVFIYDKNDDRMKSYRYTNEKLTKHQVPSLYAYNNASFTNEDWDGLISLGISGKSKNALKVGRFGLGFKSVFHLTDMPSVASQKTFAFLDPLKETLDEEVSVLDLRERLTTNGNYQDFAAFRRLGGKFWKNDDSVDGTLFRLPLRLQKSEISSVVYDDQRIRKLLEKFMKEAHLTLLFLKHVKSIKVYQMEANADTMKEMFSVGLTEESERFASEKRNFVEKVDQLVLNKSFNIHQTLNHIIEINEQRDGKNSTYKYAVSEHYGYKGNNGNFLELMLDEELSYIPLVAVAYPIHGKDDGGHIFCTLPLPLLGLRMTGMPVHINGFFALGQDRKDLKWKTISTDESNDKTVNWNIYLITELLPLAYYALFNYLIKCNQPPEVIYQAWPNVKEINSKWRIFINHFHRIIQNCSFVYVDFQNKWVQPKDVLFIRNVGGKQEQAIKQFLANAQKNCAVVPSSITEDIPCNWVNPYVINNFISSLPNAYLKLTMENQCNLLSFSVESVENLQQLTNQCLFPLCSGKYFQFLSGHNATKYFLPTEKHHKELLPTKDRVMDQTFFQYNESFRKSFVKFTKAGYHFNISVLQNSTDLVFAAKETIPYHWKEKEKVEWPDYAVPHDWIQKFTSYRNEQDILYRNLNGLPLIPVENGTKKQYLWTVSNSQSKPLLAAYSSYSISAGMKRFLLNLGVCFVCGTSPLIDLPTLVNSGVVNIPSPDSIIGYLQISGVKKVLACFPVKDKGVSDELCELIANCRLSQVPQFFESLPLLKCVGRNNYIAAKGCYLAEKYDIPAEWNPSMANLVSNESVVPKLSQKLGLKKISFDEICHIVFNNYRLMTPEQQVSFSVQVLQRIQHSYASIQLLSLFRDHGRILDDSGQLRRPTHLFTIERNLEILFLGEAGRFPDAQYHLPTLLKVGLKDKKNVNITDVLTSIQHISKSHKLPSQKRINKVNSLLRIIKENRLSGNFNSYHWIPVASFSPKGYPDSLQWRGNSVTKALEKPCNVYSEKLQWLIGSVGCVVHPDLDEAFNDCFRGTVFINNKLNIHDVLEHLRNMEKSYMSDERTHNEKMVYKIYDFISNFPREVLDAAVSNGGFNVWQGMDFVPYQQVFVNNEITKDLSPYYYNSPTDVVQKLGIIQEKLGCRKDEFTIYVSVLKQIADRNDEREEDDVADVKDTNLALSLVKELAKKYSERANHERSKIFVPIDCRKLQLHALESCFFLEVDKDADYPLSKSSNSILHRYLGKDIARILNIPSLVSKVLSGSKKSIFTPWGQKQEPLTRNLKKILGDYQDGMAIVKELIQNADDAGATEVSFLYDQRQNHNKKSKLIDPRMKDWQGPALWVYNDQTFTDEDFTNITRLNAGTKEFQTTKIGKFGLGFNSVYHLTDVPSILSGESLIIFDPHFKYLGDALKNNEPGIRISLHENIEDLANFSDQFAVFEDVFGAHLNTDPNVQCQHYPGTLFRFPLRNSSCAKESEIKQLEYTPSEMTKLFNKFESYLDTLLLFTQNVHKVSVYNLEENSLSMNEQELLFSTERTSNGYIQHMVEFANNELVKPILMSWVNPISHKTMTEPIEIKTKKNNQDVSKKTWLTCSKNGSLETYKFAKNHKGYLPYCSVAIELNSNKDSVLPVDDGHMFCFLPLAIQNKLPIHVNAAFGISNSRRSLKYHNEDDKRYGDVEWNDLIAVDSAQAYYSLLLHIKDNAYLSKAQDFYTYFPKLMEIRNSRFGIRVTRELLKLCYESKIPIFPTNEEGNIDWKQWHQLRVIGEDVPSEIMEDCITLMNLEYSRIRAQLTCVNLPIEFKRLESFKILDFESIMVSFDVVVDCLRKHLKHGYGFNSLLINRIVDWIVKKKRLEDYGLQMTSCIPCSSNGRLRKICELVRKNSEVSWLYEEQDEVFPVVNEESLNYLESLGMHSRELSWKMIVDRAKKIESSYFRNSSQPNIEELKKHSRFLLKLIEKNLENRIKCQENLKNRLTQTKFIPAMQKPEKSIFSDWLGSKDLFGASFQMFSKDLADIVSCKQLIFHDYLQKDLPEFLQVSSKADEEDVQYQMMYVMEHFKRNPEECFDALIALYKYISKNTSRTLACRFLDVAFVRTDCNQLVKPFEVFLTTSHTIHKHLYRVHVSLKEDKRISMFLKTVGVKEIADGNDFINAIAKCQSINKEIPLAGKVLGDICQIAAKLSVEVSNLEMENLYLPDKTNVLRKINQLCYNDVDWLPEDEGVLYLNPNISKMHAIELGIKSRRSDAIQRREMGFNDSWCEFGQSEEITDRIRSILESYSEPIDVFKEMFQNADDAGATEIDFILDKRHHGTTKILDDKWEYLQGPAMLVCNNGKFTKKDLKGIQAIGVGDKKEDPLKTGRYGVGFNVVYSLTDCPLLLTRVEDNEDDVLCMFDPNLKFSVNPTLAKPGCMLKDARKFLQPYDDVKQAFHFDQGDLNGKTMFRLPLRSKETASVSKISKDPVKIETLEETFKEMKKKADHFLLFLRNIKKVSFQIIKDDGSQEQVQIEVSLYDTNKRKLEEFKCYEIEYAENFGNLDDLMESEKQIHRKNCIQEFQNGILTKTNHWYVIEQVGFTNVYEIEEAVKCMLEDRNHQLVPKGGYAKYAEDSSCVNCQDKIDSQLTVGFKAEPYSLFCTLPIAITTGIPGIINGNFILSNETRRNLFTSGHVQKESEWNHTILNHCVVPCFVSYLEKIKEGFEGKYIMSRDPKKNKVSGSQNDEGEDDERRKKERTIVKYYSLFPTYSAATDPYFKEFSDKFYLYVTTNKNSILCVHKEGYVKFCDTDKFLHYHYTSAEDTNLLRALKLVNINTDNVSVSIAYQFEKAGKPLRKITPTVVRQELAANKLILNGMLKKPIDKTCIKTTSNARILLRYCLKEEENKKKIDKEVGAIMVLSDPVKNENQKNKHQISLDGLPLCFLQDETSSLACFSSHNKVFLSQFSTIFKGFGHLFLHKSLFDIVHGKAQNDCFKEFDICQFSALLLKSEYCDVLHDKHGPTPIPKDKVQEEWLANVWKYIDWLCQSKQKENEKKQIEREKEKKQKEKEKEEKIRRNEIPEEEIKDEKPKEEKSPWDMILEEINNESLLLVKKNAQNLLLPVGKRKQVLYLKPNKSTETATAALEKSIKIFTPQIYYIKQRYVSKDVKSTDLVEVYPWKALDNVFGNFESFEDVVHAMTFAFENHEQEIAVAREEVEAILLYLQTIMSEKVTKGCKEMLKSLPFFQHLDITLKRVNTKRTVIFPKGIPANGINVVEEHFDVVIVKHSEKFEKLYKFLGFEAPSWIEFLKEFVMNFIDRFDEKATMAHLTFIKGQLESRTISNSDEESLFGALYQVRCFMNRKKEKKFCRELYYTKGLYVDSEIFKLMQSESDFQSEELSSDVWAPFLKKLGMVCEVDTKHFLKYARMLEKEKDMKKFQIVSKRLCEKLKCMDLQKEISFLDQLKDICFLQPRKLNEELERLHPSLNSKHDRICYNNAVDVKHSHLVWINTFVLPTYAIDGLKLQQGGRNAFPIKKLLGILNRKGLAAELVKEVITTLTNLKTCLKPTRSRTCKRIEEDYLDSFSKILSSFYELLLKREDFTMDDLADVNFILVNESKCLDIPRRSLLGIESFSTCSPYLNTVDTKHGKYFEVLQKAGCSKKPSSNHFISVLSEIYHTSNGKPLGPNEVRIVRFVLRKFAETIHMEKELKGPLYLPTVTFSDKDNLVRMVKSTECIIADDFSMEGRLKCFKEPLVLYDENPLINESLVNNLPDEMKPAVLNKCVSEVLVSSVKTASDVEPNHIASVLRKRIRNQEFVGGITRLIIHESKGKPNDINARLKAIKIQIMEEIETELKYKNGSIPQSKNSVSVHTRLDDQELHIYIKRTAKLTPNLLTPISMAIFTFLGEPFKNSKSNVIFSNMLNIESEEISHYLNENNIKKEISDQNFMDKGKPPTLGEPVPVKLHALLRNDFSNLEIDEYVGFNENGEGDFYVYAKIISTDDKDVDKSLRMYKIQINDDDDDENILQVPRYKLYKFDKGYEKSNKTDDNMVAEPNLVEHSSSVELSSTISDDFSEECQEKSYEEIIEDIRVILKSLKDKSKEERKPVIRRLYLTWHPDKHPTNKDLATKVFQFLQNELKKLDGDDLSGNFSSWDSRASQSQSAYEQYAHDFREHFDFEFGEGQRNSSRSRGHHSRTHVPPSFNRANPQPQESKRWFKQAQSDLETAKYLQRSLTSFDWTCYISHQAAEKALKAAIYSKDYKNVDTVNNLMTLARELNDDLQDLAKQLQQLVVNNNAPRYPFSWPNPQIPSEQFTDDAARKAVEIAEKIINVVREDYVQ